MCLKVLARVLCAHREEEITREEQHPASDREEQTPFTDSNRLRANGKHSSHTSPSAPVTMETIRLRQAEWRTVASVIDRLFFLIYVIGIVLSLIFVFPRWVKQDRILRMLSNVCDRDLRFQCLWFPLLVAMALASFKPSAFRWWAPSSATSIFYRLR